MYGLTIVYLIVLHCEDKAVAVLGVSSGEIGGPHLNYLHAMTALFLGTRSTPPKPL